MPTTPRLEDRPEQHYAAVQITTTMAKLGADAPLLIGEVFGSLARRSIPPDGPAFFRYLAIDMNSEVTLDVGVPVATAVPAEGRVRAGTLPAGIYGTVLHTGPYDGLMHATADLLAWAEQNGIAWDKRPADHGEAWGARVEFYLTDPDEQPNPEMWQTELAFRTALDQARTDPRES